MENWDHLLSIVLFVVTVLVILRYKTRQASADVEFQQLPSIGRLRSLTSGAVKRHYILLFIIPVSFFLLGLIIFFFQIQQYSRYGLLEKASGFSFSNPFSGKTLQEIALKLFYDLPGAFSFLRFFSYFNPLFVFIFPLFVVRKTGIEKGGKYLFPFLLACLFVAGVLGALYFKDSIPGAGINILHSGLDVLQLYFTAYLYGYIIAVIFALLDGNSPDMQACHIVADRSLSAVFSTMLLYTLLTDFEIYAGRFLPAFDPGFPISRTFLTIIVRLFYLVLIPRLVLYGKSIGREIIDTKDMILQKGVLLVKPFLAMAVIQLLLLYVFRVFTVTSTVPGVFLLMHKVLYFVFYFPLSMFMVNYLVSCIHAVSKNGTNMAVAD